MIIKQTLDGDKYMIIKQTLDGIRQRGSKVLDPNRDCMSILEE